MEGDISFQPSAKRWQYHARGKRNLCSPTVGSVEPEVKLSAQKALRKSDRPWKETHAR
jgi:hypothetical protein